MHSPSLCEKRARFSLSTILVHITCKSSTTTTATPAAEAATIPATALRWLLLLLLMYIATVFLLIATVVSPLLVTHVPVLLASVVAYVSIEGHLLVMSSRLLLLLSIHPVL